MAIRNTRNWNTGANLDRWFPDVIGFYMNINHKSYEQKLVDRFDELKSKNKESTQNHWISNVYNTSFDLLNDEVFKDISNFQQKSVEQYVDQTQMYYEDKVYNPKLSSSWINDYQVGDFQEYHTHQSIISTIYFITGEETDARVIFQSLNYESYPISYDTDCRPVGRAFYTPLAGKLLVFRSHLQHSVEQKKNNSRRLTLASNYT